MSRSRPSFCRAYGAILAAGLLVSSCGRLQPSVGYGKPEAETPAPARPAEQRRPRDTSTVDARTYRFEDELPERTPTRPAELVERIAPLAVDTFEVSDMAVEEAPKQLYAVGYRIQVFASSDRAAAEATRQRVVAQSRMNAYIEFEDGLYKVRAGDFSERKDALQAKLSLEKAFPGCWVVRTTIRSE